jgi:hypothetical protein
MPADLRYCATLVQCFEQFSNWPMIGDDGRRRLVEHLASQARDDHEAHAAIQDLLADPARASSPATNKVPTMGELSQWLASQRQDQYDTPPPISSKGGCGKVFEGWFYDDHEGRHPSHCAGGWVRRTVWREVRGMVGEQGERLMQPYEYSGRCKCKGGWL